MPSCLAHPTFSSLLPDTSCTFLRFGTIRLILKHEKVLRRKALYIKTADRKSHQPGILSKITLLHRFLSFIMELIVPNRDIHNISFDKTFIRSFHPVFVFPKVIPELWIQIYIDTIFSLPPMFLVGTIHYFLVQDI